MSLANPADTRLPFFAYGLFRPGQPAFFQIGGFVRDVLNPCDVPGSLFVRDGLPLMNPSADWGKVRGALLAFEPEAAKAAYRRIGKMEPQNHYEWQETKAGSARANVLVDRVPEAKGDYVDGPVWNAWSDPLFTTALEVVGEMYEENRSRDAGLGPDAALRPFFKLQMAYLLLWSAIERYLALRYNLLHAQRQVSKFASERAFKEGLKAHCTKPRRVLRADNPNEVLECRPNDPAGSARYYYQVRCNVTHRGKGVLNEFRHLKYSLAELLPIFRSMLKAAEDESGWPIAETR